MEVIGDGLGGYDVRTWRLDPVQLGFAQATMDDLRGGDAAFNARVIRGVLNGDRGPRRDIGVLNAAAALVIAGNAVDLSEGVAQASASVDSGRAAEVLDELVRVSSISALDAEVG
jgi:anthranilate phosphoribosyltransferase